MENKFAHDLIKGKIAENIFELMFQESGKFLVTHFGYEYSQQFIAQNQQEIKYKKVLESMRNAPDFALFAKDMKQIYLVEVKYRASTTPKELEEIAAKMVESWDPSWLFVISKNGFYFDAANRIKHSGGKIPQLTDSWIPKKIQSKYSRLADDYLWKHKDAKK